MIQRERRRLSSICTRVYDTRPWSNIAADAVRRDDSMSAAAGGGAAAAAIARAIRASGVLVRVRPEDFQMLLRRARDPLVVCGRGGFLYRSYAYLLSYKGLAFYTKSSEPISLPSTAETVTAGRIWVP